MVFYEIISKLFNMNVSVSVSVSVMVMVMVMVRFYQVFYHHLCGAKIESSLGQSAPVTIVVRIE